MSTYGIYLVPESGTIYKPLFYFRAKVMPERKGIIAKIKKYLMNEDDTHNGAFFAINQCSGAGFSNFIRIGKVSVNVFDKLEN